MTLLVTGRRALRACVVGFACALALVLAGGQAWAHAELIATDPGQGAILPAAPAQVSLTFGESVEVAADGVRIFAPDGRQVDTGQATHLGRAAVVGVGLREGSEQGTYTVSWRVISADSHPVSGAFTFSVGHPSASRAPSAPEPSGSNAVAVLYAIARAMAFAAFAVLTGSIGYLLICSPAAVASRAIRRTSLAGWAGLLVATLVCLLLQGPYGYGLGLGHALDSAIVSETLASRIGTALQARFLLLALTGGYLVLLCSWVARLKGHGRWWFGGVGAVLMVGLTATWAAADHSAVGLQPALALPADMAHLAAMGLWLGGLVTIVVALRRPDPDATAEVSAAVRRFSRVAAGSVVVLIGTGAYQAWRQLGSWNAWISTAYGWLLLLKVAVVACLLGAAALSRRWVVRRRSASAGFGSLRRSVLAETALGGVVLAVTALLVNTEPARTATAAPLGPVHRVVDYDTAGPGGTGRLEVDVDPAASGPNTVTVVIEDTAGKPRDVPEFHAALTLEARELGPLDIPLQHTGIGSYRGSEVQFPASGTWRLTLTVRTSDIDETTVAATIDVR